jgi:hypothetical protein
MSGEERVAIAFKMSADVREICSAGIRSHHPDWTDAQVRRQMLIRVLGQDLVERAWGPLPRP